MLSDEKNSLFIWNYMKMNQNHVFRGADTTMLMGSMSLYESNMITKDSTAWQTQVPWVIHPKLVEAFPSQPLMWTSWEEKSLQSQYDSLYM